MASFNFSNFFESLGFTVTVLMLPWFSSLYLLSHQRCSRLNSFKHNIWADDSDLYISIRCYRASCLLFLQKSSIICDTSQITPIASQCSFHKEAIKFSSIAYERNTDWKWVQHFSRWVSHNIWYRFFLLYQF